MKLSNNQTIHVAVFLVHSSPDAEVTEERDGHEQRVYQWTVISRSKSVQCCFYQCSGTNMLSRNCRCRHGHVTTGDCQSLNVHKPQIMYCLHGVLKAQSLTCACKSLLLGTSYLDSDQYGNCVRRCLQKGLSGTCAAHLAAFWGTWASVQWAQRNTGRARSCQQEVQRLQVPSCFNLQ